MSTSRPTLVIAGQTLTVPELEVRHGLDRPACAEITVTMPDTPLADAVRGWLGTSVVLRYNDPDDATETWRVVSIEVTDRRLRLQLGGALSALALSGSNFWRDNASLLDCACAVLARHQITSPAKVSHVAATTALPLLAQPATDDLTFLRHLCDAGGFVAVDTLDKDGVALIEAPTLGQAAVKAADGVAQRVHFLATATAPGQLGTLLEAGGRRDGVASGNGTAPATVLPGVTLANDALRAQLEARALRGGAAITYRVETLQAGPRPGWGVDVAGLEGGLGVTSVVRTLDSNGRVRSTLSVAKGADFTAGIGRPPPLPPVPLQVARVVSSEAHGLPGYLTVAIDHPAGTAPTQFPAQIAGQGSGTGNGTSMLPQPGALALVAFAGDGLMPRPIVLSVLRNHNDLPPQHAGKPADTLVVASTTTGTEMTVTGSGDGEALTMSVGNGGASVTLSADGSVYLVGKAVTIEADTLTLRGSAIKLEEK